MENIFKRHLRLIRAGGSIILITPSISTQSNLGIGMFISNINNYTFIHRSYSGRQGERSIIVMNVFSTEKIGFFK